jgi:2-amino-4-hydroxy-6-hydroxymethyldihydropteridine diphosphokinase
MVLQVCRCKLDVPNACVNYGTTFHSIAIMIGQVFVALGGNQTGAWGTPVAAFRRAVQELRAYHVEVVAQSHIYSTEPVGGGRQGRFMNAVIEVRSPVAPATLLKILKNIERAAGRISGRVSGPRPLDLDIIDFGGRVVGWPCRRRVANLLVLPHPAMHLRPFALVPLLDIAPGWQHPALRQSGRQLLARCRSRSGAVRYLLDFPQVP